jgi:hypothetical protein
MRIRTILALVIATVICHSAFADDKITLHENLHSGDKVTYAISQTTQDHSDGSHNGVPSVMDTHTVQTWKFDEYVLAVKDGSATEARMDFTPDSADAVKESDQPEKKAPCPFAGKSVKFTAQTNAPAKNDFQFNGNNASSEDLDLLGGLLTPDEDSFPDKPVAVGDTWDNSDRIGKKMDLAPKDHFSATFKLDSVKTVDGKQIAQLSYKSVFTYHVDAAPDGPMAADTVDEQSGSMLVDIAAGMIIQSDGKETRKVNSPPGAADRLSELVEETIHSEVIPAAAK